MSKKNKCLIVYGGFPISVNLIKTLISENCHVTVIDHRTDEKSAILRDFKDKDSYKYIPTDKISDLSSTNNKFDYIFILLDQHIEGKSSFTSSEYIENLKVIHNIIDISKSTKANTIITFPINIYPFDTKKQYSLDNLLKEVNHEIETYDNIKIVYTGDLIGPGMQLNDSTPFKKILFDSILDKKIYLIGEGLDSYYPVYSSDYTLGLVQAIFSSEKSNFRLHIKEKISCLSFSYSLLEVNKDANDILFRNVEYEPMRELDIPNNTKLINTRFSLNDMIEKTHKFLIEILKDKIGSIKHKNIIDKEEKPKKKINIFKLFMLGIFKIFSKIRSIFKSINHKVSLFLKSPINIMISIISGVFTFALFYFFLIPMFLILVNMYTFFNNFNKYSDIFSSGNSSNTSTFINKITNSSTQINKNWNKLYYIGYIDHMGVKNIVNKMDNLTASINYCSMSISNWENEMKNENSNISKLIEYNNYMTLSQANKTYIWYFYDDYSDNIDDVIRIQSDILNSLE